MLLNLDKLAAEFSQKMVKTTLELDENLVDVLDRLVTKTLGVLQQQGIYAMAVFLFSRSSDEEKVAPLIWAQLHALIWEIPGFDNRTIDDIPVVDKKMECMEFLSDEILEDLTHTLLLRDLFEQTLIYARYSAKAAKPEGRAPEEEEQPS